MKKIKYLLSVVGILLALVPLKVKADNTYSYSTNFGQMKVEWVYEDESNGIKLWTFKLTPKSTYKYLYFGLVPTGVEIQEVKTDSKTFLLMDKSTNSSVTNVLLAAVDSKGISSGTEVTLVTVKTKDVDTSNCKLDFSPGSLKCAVVSGNYFDNNGNNVTAAEYKVACEGETPDPDPDVPSDPDIPDNPKSGIPVPYIAVGGGLVAIAGVYFFSKKSNKMYKI